ncbi:MAG TPA: glycosyltransferase [Candidatus Eisenbacteria bacterium]|jgi:hopene-associated glycosyltransferase HpnB|nr:glycosyltransferase [Candidatus Eisenbacteria bacterium]
MSLPFLVEILSFLSLAIWLVLFLSWGKFWRVWESDADHSVVSAPQYWPRVTAVIPARNEAASIAAVIVALAKQDYPGEFSVIIVDDHSEDATAELARNAGTESGAPSRFQVITAPNLAAGWTGKLWALNSGIGVATAKNPAPEFLWFTDADVAHGPDTLRRLVTRAQQDNLDLTSLMVLLESQTFAERLLIPAFLYFFLMLYPPNWIANPRGKTAGAAGGCILLHRAALDRIGGLVSIRNEIIDDCSLARVVKRSGGKIWMGLTRASHSLRGDSGLAEIRDMIARTAFTQLHYSALQLFGTLAGLTITFLVPVALTFAPSPRIWLPALLAWCLMTASFLPTITFYHLSPLWSPLLPLSALFYSYATFLSALRHWQGRGAQWKGRSQTKTSS